MNVADNLHHSLFTQTRGYAKRSVTRKVSSFFIMIRLSVLITSSTCTTCPNNFIGEKKTSVFEILRYLKHVAHSKTQTLEFFNYFRYFCNPTD